MNDGHQPHLPVPIASYALASDAPPVSALEVLEAFQARLKPSSLLAYRRDLKFWSKVATTANAAELLRHLIHIGPGRTNLLALQALTSMTEAALSPATINRRISALKSLLAAARMVGVITWSLEVRGPKRAILRDTRGPGIPATMRMLALAGAQLDPVRADRDRAILWLLFGVALRVGEVAGLSLGDVELGQHRIWVLGKGLFEKIPITLPRQVERAVASWIACRGPASGDDPLFVALDFVHHGHRLTSRSMHRTVLQLGHLAGVRTWPHGLRHSAITAALDGGADVRQVRRFSRHASLDTLLKYDDNRTDLGGVVAQRVADLSNEPATKDESATGASKLSEGFRT